MPLISIANGNEYTDKYLLTEYLVSVSITCLSVCVDVGGGGQCGDQRHGHGLDRAPAVAAAGCYSRDTSDQFFEIYFL